MYKGFVIKKSTIEHLPTLYLSKIDSDRYNKLEEEIEKELGFRRILLKRAIMGHNGITDADKVMNVCMPQNHRFHIFISHSHKDIKYARRLSDYILRRFGLLCFIDSEVWLNSQEDIQEPYDLRYMQGDCLQYDDILKSTAHVHAMLSMSLLKMMDSCECCIFIDPEEKYVPNNSVSSPWIYEEVTMFNYIDKHLSRSTLVTETYSQIPRIIYRCDFSNMNEITSDDMAKSLRGTMWLDSLYNK